MTYAAQMELKDSYSATQEDLPIEFMNYSNTEGISLVHRDDWIPWYDCWLHGYKTAKKEEK